MNIDSILKEIERFGMNNPMFNIPKKSGIFLHLLVKLVKPKKILEIGTSNGYSTIWLAREGGEVTTIEENDGRVNMARENFEKAGLKNIKLIEGDALQVLDGINEEFDFVFIDARKKDYLNYLKKIKVKGVVVADNIISHEGKVKDYVDYVRENYESFLIEVGSGMEVSFL